MIRGSASAGFVTSLKRYCERPELAGSCRLLAMTSTKFSHTLGRLQPDKASRIKRLDGLLGRGSRLSNSDRQKILIGGPLRTRQLPLRWYDFGRGGSRTRPSRRPQGYVQEGDHRDTPLRFTDVPQSHITIQRLGAHRSQVRSWHTTKDRSWSGLFVRQTTWVFCDK